MWGSMDEVMMGGKKTERARIGSGDAQNDVVAAAAHGRFLGRGQSETRGIVWTVRRLTTAARVIHRTFELAQPSVRACCGHGAMCR